VVSFTPLAWTDLTLAQLEQPDFAPVIFRAITGSRAYGLARPESDTDVCGIYVVPATAHLSIRATVQHVADERNNTTYYSIGRVLQLAAESNPNITELLYLPDDCLLRCTPEMRLLLEHRSLFISKMAYNTYIGYARAQVKKARGQNKWINNPQPQEPPCKEDFCWFIPPGFDAGKWPLRPVPLGATEVSLAQCHCASVEHIAHLYRLYHYGPAAKGVFRHGNLVCEAIPASDEHARCIGLLLYNREAYERALREHQNYWSWVGNRNAVRWQTQERGEIDYDAKNMMHTFRLLFSGAKVLEEGQPLVRVAGEQQAFLKAVLAGRYTYDELTRRAEGLIAGMDGLLVRSELPAQPDPLRIDALLREITAMWENNHAWGD
jgi:uncharacterized protein